MYMYKDPTFVSTSQNTSVEFLHIPLSSLPEVTKRRGQQGRKSACVHVLPGTKKLYLEKTDK